MTATLTRPPVATTSQPVVTAPDAVQAFRAGLFKFTAADWPVLIEAGILPEYTTVELLGGLFVYRDCGDSKGQSGVSGLGHDYAVRTIAKFDRHVDTPDRRLVTQITLQLEDVHTPIPDAMVLRGPPTAYRARHPNPADVLCLIEVADSSYAGDAGEKRTAYARAGVPQYVIVNLRDRTAEVYAGPDVAVGTSPPPRVVQGGGATFLYVGDGETVAADLATLWP